MNNFEQIFTAKICLVEKLTALDVQIFFSLD